MPSGHDLQGGVTLFISMGHLKCGAQIGIQFILDYYPLYEILPPHPSRVPSFIANSKN